MFMHPIKAAVMQQGRVLDVLQHVAGIPLEILEQPKREFPCPKCGGNTRCRLIDADAGAVRCSHCHPEKCGDFIAAVKHFRGVSHGEALQLIAERLGMTPGSAVTPQKTTPWKAVKTWTYTDKAGTPIYYVTRQERLVNGKREKKFVQYRKENGKTTYNLDGVAPVPLHWPELDCRPDDPVYIVEGEKCCDALTALGLLATTASGGSNSKLAWSKFLYDRHVVIFPDQDQPGYKYALDVATSLWGRNQVKVVFLPDLAEKEDISDWIERGGTIGELTRIVENTPDWDGSPFAYSNGNTAEEPTTNTLPRRILLW